MFEVGYMAHRQKMLHTPVLGDQTKNTKMCYCRVQWEKWWRGTNFYISWGIPVFDYLTQSL